MKRVIYGSLILGAAMSLSAQTLAVGSASVTPGGTGSVNVTLSGGGGNPAGLQFDLTYDSTKLSGVTVTAGTSTSNAGKSVYSNASLGTGVYRAVIIGADGTASALTASGSTGLADGVVATISFTLGSGVALNTSTPLTLSNTIGTTAAATGINIGATPGSITASNVSYLVGDVYPYTADTAGSFGDGKINILDLVQELFATTGLLVPTACSDRFDAMDTFPVDTTNTRGGDGKLNILDLVEQLFRETGLDPSLPTRTSRGGVCAGASAQPAVRTTATLSARAPVAVQGSLQFGTAEPVNGGEQIPVYLQARQDLVRTAVSFGIADQHSQLRFVPVLDLAPSLTGDGQVGSLAVAWLNGLNLGAGQRLLLGYVVAPAGTSSNLKMFGVSAGSLNDSKEVGLEVSGMSLARQ